MNRATRINVATVGSIFGLSGMTHGFAETLQGWPSGPASPPTSRATSARWVS